MSENRRIRKLDKTNLTIDRQDLLSESLFLAEVVDAANHPSRLAFILSSAETCQLQLVAKLVSAVVLCKTEAPHYLADRLRTNPRRSAIKKQFAFKSRLRHLLNRPHDDIAEALRLLLPLLSDIIGCFVTCGQPEVSNDNAEEEVSAQEASQSPSSPPAEEISTTEEDTVDDDDELSQIGKENENDIKMSEGSD